MKNELVSMKEIDDKIKNELDSLANNLHTEFNHIKALKNNIYEKTTKVFIYNLKKLIQMEHTQKNLANKIGVSEDLLSKYKSGEAFPSIETLIFISKVYNISMEKLVGMPMSLEDISIIEVERQEEENIFNSQYYVYFLVTNLSREGAIHEGTIEFNNNKVIFKILSKTEVIKCFTGKYNFTDKLIFFNLTSEKDGSAYINIIKPNLNKDKYLGGVGILMLSSDANSKPCAQKILFSRVKLDRELEYDRIRELLSFCAESVTLGHVKINQWEDEKAYSFINNRDVNKR